jgi:transposase
MGLVRRLRRVCNGGSTEGDSPGIHARLSPLSRSLCHLPKRFRSWIHHPPSLAPRRRHLRATWRAGGGAASIGPTGRRRRRHRRHRRVAGSLHAGTGNHPGSHPWRRDQLEHATRTLSFDREAYRRRNSIERCVGWLKEARRIATRYEKLAVQYLGVIAATVVHRSALCCNRSTKPRVR